ncbi:MAG: penicillin-binding protein 2 [Candidatus Aminicenantes bacterium]|nr:MAG: penicillin-binding protein 2 [Candidatus Aminicenantes bacterium]
MENNKIYEDLSPIVGRTQKTFILVEILFVFLVFYFWKTQILDYKKFLRQSEANRIREVVLQSPRGLILDREGVILADNEASFTVSIIRENCKDLDKSCKEIAQILDLEEDVVIERIKKYENWPLFRPIVVKDNLSFEEVALIEARKLELPELIIEAEPKRFYPFKNFAAHVLGYLQELSPEEIESGNYVGRRMGELVGKTGIEKVCENRLVGTDGEKIEIVDSLGRSKGEVTRHEPKKGQNIRLSLDFELQQKAEELLEGREGAVVVLDARNGGILALASYPDFDPNRFINRFTPGEWLDLVNSPEFPLENRAIRGLYSPGSIFKLTMALGALHLGVITDQTTYFCPGKIQIYGHPRSCWFEQGHGSMNLYNGIRHSCNIYFYQLGKEMGIDNIARIARKLGMGRKTGIDLLGEKAGLVPDPQWKKKARGESWYPGETISVAIGQGPILVTPLQIAVHTAIIANRGYKVTPYLLISDSNSPSKVDKREHLVQSRAIDIEESVFEKVIEGMWKVVNEQGTGRAARISGFDICGKTGSTQLISSAEEERLEELEEEVKTHSWFTGFAPRDNPEVVITVLVEYGGMGGATAAPVARLLFDLYRKKYD